MAQKPQFRVQTLPRTMKVAVPSAQHSPWFGQRASSQTVCRASARISRLTDAYVSPTPMRTFSHSGRRPPGPAFSGIGSPGASSPPSTLGPPGYITSDGEAWPGGGPMTVSSPRVEKSGVSCSAHGLSLPKGCQHRRDQAGCGSPAAVRAGSSGRSFRPRSSWALAATTMVDTLITSAPTLIGSEKPSGTNRPAATGMAMAL